ncbi:alpha/beta hydrolase [Dyadobacter arcticus]|uniref:Pimeloyl-ACP methyl ester carboxylesterase n=1 Tax=Dyadobacter arcticus TaxID=1078754 RepID=A0ABX0UUS9_9BACT|nr:alpha/beta hydrolase [Dyadobacter arcticus]NIJ54681.1 pimeloyl-ACP methyl ester carboxylesterase [Dyadobacter arcticus]
MIEMELAALKLTLVVGLVFIDPTDFMLTNEEDQLVRTRSKSAIGYQKLWQILLKKMESDTLTPVGIRYEMSRQYNASVPIFFKEYRSISALPPIPTTVFIAYNRRVEQHELALSKELKINLKPWFKELDQLRIQHYAQMIENSPQSRLILLPQYSHGIHQQDPILVSNAILEVLKTIGPKPK